MTDLQKDSVQSPQQCAREAVVEWLGYLLAKSWLSQHSNESGRSKASLTSEYRSADDTISK